MCPHWFFLVLFMSTPWIFISIRHIHQWYISFTHGLPFKLLFCFVCFLFFSLALLWIVFQILSLLFLMALLMLFLEIYIFFNGYVSVNLGFLFGLLEKNSRENHISTTKKNRVWRVHLFTFSTITHFWDWGEGKKVTKDQSPNIARLHDSTKTEGTIILLFCWEVYFFLWIEACTHDLAMKISDKKL